MTAVVLLAGMVSGTAAAVIVGSGTLGGFESDGNFESNGNLDWANVAPVVATDDSADSGFQGSSKEEEPTNWTCNTGGANPGKGNILKAYISPRIEQNSAFLDIGYVRQDGNGDAHVNFEFNKMPSTPGSNSGACPIVRTTDDFLVTYDFAGGDDPADIRVWRWNGTKWIELMIGANDAKGATNSASVTDPNGNTVQVREFGEGTLDLLSTAIPQGFIGCPGFGYANIRSRSSHSITSALQDRLPTTPVDLNTCGKIIVHKVDDRLPSGQPLAGATFGLFTNSGATGSPLKTAVSGADGKATFSDVVPGAYYVKELSAPANHTADADIVGPITVGFKQTVDVAAKFENPIIRLAKIKIDPQKDANQIGDDHPLTVTVTKKGANQSDFVAAPGVDVTFSKVSGPGSFKNGDDTCTTSASGECSVILVSSDVGLTTVSASASVLIDTKPVSVSTNGQSGSSGPAKKRWVDARLKLTPPKDANRVGDTHTFTASLEFDKGDGSGFVSAPAGEQIDFTKSGLGTLAANSCTTNASGECTVNLVSPLTGLSTVVATWGGGVATADGTASATASSDDAKKQWVDVKLDLTPESAVNRVSDPHTFTTHLQFDKGDGNGFADAPAGEQIDFTKSGVGTLSASSCTTSAAGTCTVVLTSGTTGSSSVQASWNGNVATANGTVTTSQTDTATKDWVDALITINPPQDTNEVGDDHVFTVAVYKKIGGVTSPAAGVLTDASITSGPGAFIGGNTCTTNANGECTVVIRSNTPGLTTVEAAATILVNGKAITLKTDGAGGNTSPAKKRWVAARLNLTPAEDANQIGDTHKFTAHLEFDKGDGNGFADATGETVSFIESGPGTLVNTTCTTDATGTCSVDLESSQTGLSTVIATWNGSVTTAEGTATMDAKTDTAVKRWVDARLSLTPPQAANQVGDDHTFTAHLEFDTGSGFGDAPAGKVIALSKVSGPGTLSAVSCTTNADGTCTVVLSSGSTGLTTVEAAWIGTVATAEGTASASATPDEAVKRWVDARLSLTPPKAANQVGDLHTFTAHLEFDTGSGFADAPAGKTIDLAKTSGPGALSATSCDTDANGECTFDLSSAVTGLTTVHATFDGTIATAQGTADATASSDDAVKRWVDARLQLTPPQAANRVGDTHTFTATLEFDKGDANGFVAAPAGEQIDFTESGPGTLATDSCTTNASGQCTVALDSTLTGLSTVTASWDGGVATAEGTAQADADPDQAVKRWINVQLDLTPETAVNRIGDTHTFTAHLMFDEGDGNGFVDAGAGEQLGFAKTGVGTLSASNCTTGADGTCTVDLDSDVTGSSSVTASWNGDVVTAEGTVTTSQTDAAEKHWVDALILINPPQATNEVGDDHVYTISVQQKSGGVSSPATGLNVHASIVSGPGSFIGPDGCTTNATGDCTVTISSDATGLTTVQAEATVVVNGKSIVVKTDGAGGNASPAVKRWVNARLSVTPVEATNRLGDPHVFTAHLELDKGDGDGFVDGPSGESISWSKASGPGTFTSDTCVTDQSGSCTTILDSTIPGTSEVHASWTGDATTAEGSATMSRGATATKLWIAPDILIVKTADPETGGPRDVTYTYVVTNTGDSTLVDIAVTDDILGDIGTIDVLEPGESATLERVVAVDVDSPTTNIGEACGIDPLGGEVCDTDDAEIAVVLGAEVFPPVLPKTGFGLRLWLLWAGALLAAGAAALSLEETMVRRRAGPVV